MNLGVVLNSFWRLRGMNMAPSSFLLSFFVTRNVLRFRFGLKTDAPSIEKTKENISLCIAIRTMKVRMSTFHPPIR